MKKLLIGAVSVVALSFAFAGAPVAAPGFNPSQFCTDNGDWAPLFASHAECTRYFARAFNKAGSDDAAAICKASQDIDPDVFATLFKNIGQCVKSFH